VLRAPGRLSTGARHTIAPDEAKLRALVDWRILLEAVVGCDDKLRATSAPKEEG
jgi:hypothetical protein